MVFSLSTLAHGALLRRSCGIAIDWGWLGTHLTANARRSEAGAGVVGQDGHGALAAPTPDGQLRRDPTLGAATLPGWREVPTPLGCLSTFQKSAM